MRGETTVSLMWVLSGAGALIVAGAGMLYNLTSSIATEVTSVKDVNAEQDTRIATVEVRTERIQYLEAKVDKLLEREGINPALIKPLEDKEI